MTLVMKLRYLTCFLFQISRVTILGDSKTRIFRDKFGLQKFQKSIKTLLYILENDKKFSGIIMQETIPNIFGAESLIRVEK